MRRGFTLVEIVVVMGVILAIMALTVPNIVGAREQVQINSAAAAIVADIRQQQLKAMLGDTEGRAAADAYGVHFESNSYTLFHGPNYIPGEPSNAVFSLPGNLQFSTVGFPAAALVFAKGSGEISGFTVGADNFLLFNPANNQAIQYTFNRYGAVTGAQ